MTATDGNRSDAVLRVAGGLCRRAWSGLWGLSVAVVLLTGACNPSNSSDDLGAAGRDPKQASSISATRVEAATVNPASATIRLERPGEVEPARDARLAAALGGFIEYLRVEVGDHVRRGRVLARVDTSLQSANAKLAQVELDDAERELKRLRSMGKAIPRARVDAAETRLARAQAQARIARIQTKRTIIRAPFSGVVADVSTERGEVAPAGAQIVRVISDEVIVSVSVTDRDVAALEVGGKARVTAGGVAEPIDGTISRIEPTANLKTRSFTVEVEVPDSQEVLRPGMIATVDFQRQVATEALLIPQDLLVTRLDQNGVFLVEDGPVARWQPLELGQVVRDQVLITGGLKPGANVVVSGHRSLIDGDELIIERQGECCVDGRIVFSGLEQVAAAEQEEPQEPQEP